MDDSAIIGGGWLGTYAYKGTRRSPVRFEATIAAPSSDGQFSGTILDDGNLGEADISGVQSGRGFWFSKVYRSHKGSSVFYEGTLTEDGQTMQGTWKISALAHGVWDARRAWSNNDNAEETVLEQDEPRVREVVRLG